MKFSSVLQLPPYTLSYFSQLLRGLSLSKIFVEFLSDLYITLCFGKIFKVMVLKVLENAFVIQNIESIHFYSCPQATLPQVLIITPRQKEINHFTQAAFFENLSPFRRKGVGEGNYGVKKITKIKLVKVLATSFLKSHRLGTLYLFGFCFVVPYLDSSMLKCEGSLT